MTRKAHLVGAVIGSAGLLASGAPAFADSVQKNVLDLGEDVVKSAPVQVCHSQLAEVGSVVAGVDGCVDGAASVRSNEGRSGSEGEPGSGGADGGDSYAHVEVTLPETSGDQGHEHSSPEHFPPGPVQNPADPEPDPPGHEVMPEDDAAKLPVAPTPDSVRGHHAVTG